MDPINPFYVFKYFRLTFFEKKGSHSFILGAGLPFIFWFIANLRFDWNTFLFLKCLIFSTIIAILFEGFQYVTLLSDKWQWDDVYWKIYGGIFIGIIVWIFGLNPYILIPVVPSTAYVIYNKIKFYKNR